MRVLIISFTTMRAAPSGPAYVAGAALAAGHTVEVFDSLFAPDLNGLEEQISRFEPHVIGISIKFVNGDIVDESAEFNTRRFDHRHKVKDMVERIEAVSDAHIVLGGPGFNYYGPHWFEYLDLDYGLRGEADLSFPLYLQRLGEGGDVHSVPGCIFREDGHVQVVPRDLVADLDATALPAYELFDLDAYLEHGISPAIVTKRGCTFRCTFCPYSSLEGKRYRLKSPRRVVDEIEHVCQARGLKKVSFCDNSFNVPKKHAREICQEILDRKLDIEWYTGALKPVGITDELCELFKASGCTSVGLAVETASATMLKSMGRGYTVDHVKKAMTCLNDSGLPFGVSLLFGAPGETPETIAETLDVIDSFSIPDGFWASIGLCLWTHHQAVVEDARRAGQFESDKELFDGAYYISPELPKDYMIELIGSLRARDDCTVQVNKAYAASS